MFLRECREPMRLIPLSHAGCGALAARCEEHARETWLQRVCPAGPSSSSVVGPLIAWPPPRFHNADDDSETASRSTRDPQGRVSFTRQHRARKCLRMGLPGTHMLVASILVAITCLILRLSSAPPSFWPEAIANDKFFEASPWLRLLTLPCSLSHSCSKKRTCHAIWGVILLWLLLCPYLAPVLYPIESQEDEVHFFSTADGARINLSRYRSHNSTGHQNPQVFHPLAQHSKCPRHICAGAHVLEM